MLLEEHALTVPPGPKRDRLCREAELVTKDEWHLSPTYCIEKRWAIVRLPRLDFLTNAARLASGLLVHGHLRLYGFRAFETYQSPVYDLFVNEMLFRELVLNSCTPDWVLMSIRLSCAMNQSMGEDYWDFAGSPELLEACIGDIDAALAGFEADIDVMPERPEYIAELRAQAARNRRICELARRARP